jgi:hypothetical protein
MAGSPPVVTVTATKTTFNDNENMDVTVSWVDPDSETLVFTGAVTDLAGNTRNANITLNIVDPCTVVPSSVPTRTWVEIARTANSVTYRAVA